MSKQILKLNTIFSKFDPRFSKGCVRFGVLTPTDCQTLIDSKLGVFKDSWIVSWITDNIKKGIMNPRHVRCDLTASGMIFESLSPKGHKR